MELFPTSINENTKKRRKWGPIRSDTDIGYDRLPNLVPKEESRIRLIIFHIYFLTFVCTHCMSVYITKWFN